MSPDHDDDDDDETKELDAPWPFGPWAHKKQIKGRNFNNLTFIYHSV